MDSPPPCGEGMGVGVVVGARGRATQTNYGGGRPVPQSCRPNLALMREGGLLPVFGKDHAPRFRSMIPKSLPPRRRIRAKLEREWCRNGLPSPTRGEGGPCRNRVALI